MFSRCFCNGSEYTEILGAFLGSETPRDLLSYIRHSQTTFCLVIRERHSILLRLN